MDDAIKTLVEALHTANMDNRELQSKIDRLMDKISDYRAALYAVRHEECCVSRGCLIQSVFNKYKDHL